MAPVISGVPHCSALGQALLTIIVINHIDVGLYNVTTKLAVYTKTDNSVISD